MLQPRADPGPPPTLVELLTEQFYAWERRGRGWQVWPYPVPLEPPFRPFLGHYLPFALRSVDDARKPTLLSTLTERLLGRAAPRRSSSEDQTALDEMLAEPEPDLFDELAALLEE